jgi:hypothetical protein
MMEFDVSWDAGTQTWCVGVGTDGHGLYGRGDTIQAAWDDLVTFLGFDPRDMA